MSTSVYVDELDIDIEILADTTSTPLVTVIDENLIIVSYTEHDPDCPHPLEDSDGEGAIYRRGRNGSKADEAMMREALGLDDNWEPVMPDEYAEPLASKVATALKINKETACELIRLKSKCGVGDSLPEVVLKASRAIENGSAVGDAVLAFFTGDFCDTTVEEKASVTKAIRAFDTSLKALSGELSSANPNAVVLDAYEHGGIEYSIHGQGMQCRFDSSSGAGVWVPDEAALENIRITTAERLDVYKAIKMVQSGLYSIKPEECRPSIITVGDKTFDRWNKAVDYALSTLDTTLVAKTQREVVLEYCKSVLNAFNAWLNGDCHCVVTERFTKEADQWVSDNTNHCGGYIGYEYAEEEAASNHKHAVENERRLRLKAA